MLHRGQNSIPRTCQQSKTESLMLPYFCLFFYLYPDFTSVSPKKEKVLTYLNGCLEALIKNIYR